MGYREVAPPAWLRGAVECGWASDAPAAAVMQNVLPDGCMDLVWTGTELLVAGPDTAPNPYLHEPGRAAAGLRFAPGALPALLGVPAQVLRDRRVALDQLHPAQARAAVGRLECGGSPLATLAELTRTLPGTPGEPGIRAVAGYLDRGATAATAADALGWTTRSLHRRCLAAFGYGPAVLRRVLRFRRAVALLHAGLPQADTAARAGYADQPHLAREVRALAGVAPGRLQRARV